MQVFCIGLTILLAVNEITQARRGLGPPNGIVVYGVFADLVSMVASILGVMLIRRGRIRQGFVTILGTYLAVLAGSLVFRGLAYHEHILIRVYWVLLVLPALLLGRRELWGCLSVVLTAMFVGYLRDAGHLGGAGPHPAPPPALGVWTQAAAVMLLLCIILDRFGAALRESYAAARSRQLEAEQASEALSAANRSLAAEMERRATAEAMLFQSQKLEAIGRLSAGVAHDFNNVITGILGFAELVKESLPPNDPSREDVEQIIEAAGRAGALTHQLLSFARRQIVEPKNLLIEEQAGAIEPILRQLIGEDIRIVKHFAADPWPVRADKVQLDQILLNLSLNARDAMPQGGTLTIATEKVEMSPAACATVPDLVPGPYVRFTIADTGKGMAPATLKNIFEPFFTTKERGKGTGLGLATCYGIVRQAGGVITVRSALGAGTTFEILLPRASADDLAQTVTKSGIARRQEARGRDPETVLIVEDEPLILEIATRVIRGAGYAVLTANHPAEAMTVAAAHRGDIALLLTDVVMPGGDGRTFAEDLKQTRPAMAVLYMSGYSDDIVAQHGVLEPGIDLLAKPFSPDALAKKVREALAARGRSSEGEDHAPSRRTGQ